MENTKDNNKVPPHSLDAEKSVLGSILIDEDTIINVSDVLVAEDFYDNKNQVIYEKIIKLFTKQQPVDILTVTEELSKTNQLEQIGSRSYLSELSNYVPSSANSKYYADIVREKATRRRLMTISRQIAEKSFDESLTLEELLGEVEQNVLSASERTIKTDLVPIESLLSESFDRLDNLHKNKGQIRGTPSGFRDLDSKLAGFQKSDLIILGARPAMGKSTLAMNIAHNVAVRQKKPVLYFSLEMSKDQLVDRILSAESGINAWDLRVGNLKDSDFELLGNAMGTLSEAPLYIDDSPGLNALEMRTKARRIHHRTPVGLIVVDYLQLMSATNNKDGRVQEITEISLGLKALARELDAPVLALSQLSRGVESRTPPRPQLQDLRESGSIEQDADLVMFLYRDEYYNPDNTDRPGISDLIIAKHRNGEVGSVELFFDDKKLQFLTLDKSREYSG